MATPPDPSVQVLQDALADFQAGLSAEDRTQLQSLKEKPDVDACIKWTASLDRMDRNRRGASIATRVYSFLQSVQQFSAIIDTFVQSDPIIAALVWGSVKFTMMVVMNYTSYFDHMSSALRDFDRWSPRIADYQLLFPTSSRLRMAVCRYYASIIAACKRIAIIARRPWQQQLAKAMFSSFHTEMKAIVAEMQVNARELKYDIALAKAQADAEEHNLQKKERRAAADQRQALVPFVASASTAIEEARTWRKNIDKQRTGQQRRDLLDVLSTFDCMSAFKQARRKRYQGTGSWLAETPAFQSWKESQANSVLWLSGKIGSGKTVLTASTIDHLFIQRQPDESVLFVLPNFSDACSLDAETILRSLARQSLDADNLSEQFASIILRAKDSMWSTDDLTQLLKVKLSTFRQTFVVLDALDEIDAPDRRTILGVFSKLVQSNGGLVKILLTSRSSMKTEITRAFPATLQLTMDVPVAHAELAAYTKAVVDERLETGDLCVSNHDLIHEIVAELSAGAQGMFLWVSLEIEDICSQTCDEDIKHALQNLPKTLADTFSRTLHRIISRGKADVCQKAFAWVLGSYRPLLLEELGEAIPIEIGQKYTRPEKAINAIDRLPSWCENLIQVDEDTSQVRFIHHTVRMYLLDTSHATLGYDIPARRFHGNLDEFQNMVGNLCITYLNFNDFKTTLSETSSQAVKLVKMPEPKHLAKHALASSLIPSMAVRLATSSPGHKSDTSGADVNTTARAINIAGAFTRASDSLDSLAESHPLLRYASKFWLQHTAPLRRSRHTYPLWMQMIEGSHGLAKTPWTAHEFASGDQKIIDWGLKHKNWALLRYVLVTRDIQQLSFARGFGHALSKGHPAFNSTWSRRSHTFSILMHTSRPLLMNEWILCQKRSRGLADLLLDAITQEFMPSQSSSLISAASRLTEKAVHRIADKSVFSAGLYQTLENICAKGVTEEREMHAIALHVYIVRGMKEEAERILTENRDLAVLQYGERFTMELAIQHQTPDMVKLLLRHGADPNQIFHGQITKSDKSKQDEMMGEELSLDFVRGPYNRMGGHDASSSVQPVDDTDEPAAATRGPTALHVILYNLFNDQESWPDSIGMLKILLDAGASPNAQDNYGRTPLHLVLKLHTRMEDLRHVLELMQIIAGQKGTTRGIDFSICDDRGYTVLVMAMEASRPGMVGILLKLGADVNSQCRPTGLTALHVAARKCFPASVKELLQHGADPFLRGSDQKDAIGLAIQSWCRGQPGALDTLKVLLKHIQPANYTLVDREGVLVASLERKMSTRKMEAALMRCRSAMITTDKVG
ncbi:hypothetical protein B0H63DRAFT_548970 [Podospora didyma]|uniref:NACHT domain-containing protein n=1 Tax=Podospora didyma TaxID=330526 RepID=A0AAE0KEZ0_9PEZI|nr:hypothetical protein B0H63DRAFT_548970 [Podospora didyma]